MYAEIAVFGGAIKAKVDAIWHRRPGWILSPTVEADLSIV